MGKVKAQIQEVREEISDLLYENNNVSLDEVKQILKNKFTFKDNHNLGYVNENLIEQLYNEEVLLNG
jgi:hypothetical protein